MTDLDMDPHLDTIFFHVYALPCNINAAITAYAAILKYKQLKFNILLNNFLRIQLCPVIWIQNTTLSMGGNM